MLNVFTRFTPLLFLFYCALFWQGCNIINPHEQTPTYVHIDSFSFRTNPSVTLLKIDGSTSPELATVSHKVNTVLVYYNNNPIGIFDLPATFPVPASGSGSLKIAPAIAVNGQNNMIAAYPFYTFDTSTLIANAGNVINHTPVSQFYSDVKVKCISNFEGGGSNATNFVLTEGNRVMQLDIDPADVLEGNACGEIRLNAVGDSSIDSTAKSFTIPLGGTTFIEFDYKSTVPFYVGLQANLSATVSSAPYFLSGINPSSGSGWQKFYLEIDGFIGKAQGSTYNFYIKAVLADGQTSGKLLIDNIQLVTF